MSSVVSFDEEWSKKVAALYVLPDVVRTRIAALDLLDPHGGDTVLDLGCGPGYMTRDIAMAVGAQGHVVGIDVSDPMLDMAREFCADVPQAIFQNVDLLNLPYEDASIDGVAVMQVFSYVPDLEAAMEEIARVLKPGGKLLVMDTDYGTLVWQSENRELADRIVKGYDGHVVWPDLPRVLPGKLGQSGLKITQMQAVPIVAADFHEGTFPHGVGALMESYAITQENVTSEEAAQWRAEQEKLASEGRFFFSINRNFFLLAKQG